MVKLFNTWLNEERGKFEVSHQKIDELTNEMLKYAKKVLNSKGFNGYISSKASAGVEWQWFQGNALEKRPYKEPSFILSGWHGTGSYGSGKIILSVYTKNLPTNLDLHKHADWELAIDSDTALFCNKMMTYYTAEAYEDYKKFLEEVKKLIDETPKLPEQK
jgi:hypothetical protein